MVSSQLIARSYNWSNLSNKQHFSFPYFSFNCFVLDVVVVKDTKGYLSICRVKLYHSLLPAVLIVLIFKTLLSNMDKLIIPTVLIVDGDLEHVAHA